MGTKKGTKNPEVDAFVQRAPKWRGEIRALRSILLDCGLDEDLKWGKPCYSTGGKNVAIVQPFREHCALLFFQGALLADPRGLLKRQGANTLRLEFRRAAEVKKTVVASFVKQAVAAARAGRRVDLAATREPELPPELTRILAKDRKLAQAFRALTPGRRRAYVLHFTGAKQAQTRTAHIEACIPRILAGKGRNDR